MYPIILIFLILCFFHVLLFYHLLLLELGEKIILPNLYKSFGLLVLSIEDVLPAPLYLFIFAFNFVEAVQFCPVQVVRLLNMGSVVNAAGAEPSMVHHGTHKIMPVGGLKGSLEHALVMLHRQSVQN